MRKIRGFKLDGLNFFDKIKLTYAILFNLEVTIYY